MKYLFKISLSLPLPRVEANGGVEFRHFALPPEVGEKSGTECPNTCAYPAVLRIQREADLILIFKNFIDLNLYFIHIMLFIGAVKEFHNDSNSCVFSVSAGRCGGVPCSAHRN